MKALVLAAGSGTRIRSVAGDRPKCLLPMNGKTMLDHQLAVLRSEGIRDIAIVRGYESHRIHPPDVQFFENPEFADTNMVHSLFCAAPFLDGELVIAYADILYSPAALRAVTRAAGETAVAVDLDWRGYYEERHGAGIWDDAESMVYDPASLSIREIGASHPDPERVMGQYVGLIKLSAAGARDWLRFYNWERANPAANGEWFRGRSLRRAFMTDFIQALILAGHDVRAALIRGGWAEVDSERDYEIAQRRVRDMELG